MTVAAVAGCAWRSARYVPRKAWSADGLRGRPAPGLLPPRGMTEFPFEFLPTTEIDDTRVKLLAGFDVIRPRHRSGPPMSGGDPSWLRSVLFPIAPTFDQY